MITFQPDLIVEVTSACNRACSGCYAPNVVSNKKAQDLLESDPGLFLELNKLRSMVELWDLEIPSTISVRGGEPSLHPHLTEILNTLQYLTTEIILETHGRWLLSKNRNDYVDLIDFAARRKITIKISFDSMHGLSALDLKEMTDLLELKEIPFLIAITESTHEEFLQSKNLCSWISDEKIIFQNKASSLEYLVKPKLAVINSKGELKAELNSKFIQSYSILEAVI